MPFVSGTYRHDIISKKIVALLRPINLLPTCSIRSAGMHSHTHTRDRLVVPKTSS